MRDKRCFIISPIGPEGSETRKHANNVRELFIDPAMKACSIKAFRADELREPGRITDQMYREILHADFCIALLTGHNPNVFFELAVAMTSGKPVIVLAEKGEQLPFDVKDLRCLYYDFDPRAIRDKVYERELVEFVANVEKMEWRAEPLLQRYGQDLPSKPLPDSYAYEQMAVEIERSLEGLSERNGELLLEYQGDGDAERLFDGIYSSILYLSRAATTGMVDAKYYGNLMELDAGRGRFRVRYFAGPYNDEIITRQFPLSRRGEGIATVCFHTQKVQIVNSMGEQLKVKGEARLNSMACIPVPNIDPAIQSRQIALLNIDSAVPNSFPGKDSESSVAVAQRYERLATLLARTNTLYRWAVEGKGKIEAIAVDPGNSF